MIDPHKCPRCRKTSAVILCSYTHQHVCDNCWHELRAQENTRPYRERIEELKAVLRVYADEDNWFEATVMTCVKWRGPGEEGWNLAKEALDRKAPRSRQEGPE